jgi:hypothetical protein
MLQAWTRRLVRHARLLLLLKSLLLPSAKLVLGAW